MGMELVFMFAPFAVVLIGLMGEKFKVSKLREAFAIIVSLFTLYSVWSIYTMVQASATGILVVTLGGSPPLGACFEIDMLSVYMAFSAALLGLFATIYS
jgi:formate hydrogenlyase subunit 3/multisubunit Na+/H+ antiporter MnhD subunit